MKKLPAVLAVLLACSPLQAATLDTAAMDAFVRDLAANDGFDPTMVRGLLDRAVVSETIIGAISKPAEAKPWYKYRPIFLTRQRIDGGVAFWREHAATLARAESALGVPAEVIVAIIGVETSYGRNTGSHRVMDALKTLAFAYEPRKDFFRRELRAFLLLGRDQDLDFFSLKGSYAGAMGLPQFMPSSYLAYAVDFDDDGRTDIWSNPADAIGSVANYLREHGWRAGQIVTAPSRVEGDGYLGVIERGLKPELTVAELAQLGIRSDAPIEDTHAAALIRLENETGPEYWLGLNNFYVITRYNRSPLYAMAVHQLSEAIRAAYRGS